MQHLEKNYKGIQEFFSLRDEPSTKIEERALTGLIDS
jgi:hypothetical protein